VRIEVEVFGHFIDYLSSESRREKRAFLDLPQGARISDLIARLKIPRKEVSLLMRNDEQASEDEVLADGDVVGIFPPISGGAEIDSSWRKSRE
jgi:molybdopterin converting factor small subunit